MSNNTQLTNAVAVSGGKVTTTSLKIAEIFGKRHDHVIRDIESLQIHDNWRKPNFGETSFDVPQPNGGIRKCKMYIITRDGFTILAMGFTGAKAMQFKIAYIEAFNAMETKLQSMNALPCKPMNAAITNVADKPDLPDAVKTRQIFEHRVFFNGLAVIPTKHLAEILGVSANSIRSLRKRHNDIFVEGKDVFDRVNGRDYRKVSIQRNMAGYPISAAMVTLYTESGVRKIAKLVKYAGRSEKRKDHIQTKASLVAKARPMDVQQPSVLKPLKNANNLPHITFTPMHISEVGNKFEKTRMAQFCRELIKAGYDMVPLLEEFYPLWMRGVGINLWFEDVKKNTQYLKNEVDHLDCMTNFCDELINNRNKEGTIKIGPQLLAL